VIGVERYGYTKRNAIGQRASCIEMNPIFFELLEGGFQGICRVAAYRVTLVTDEARSFFKVTRQV
jgi:hypothetical protein